MVTKTKRKKQKRIEKILTETDYHGKCLAEQLGIDTVTVSK